MTNTKKNVIVVSARRSGTHLLVDLIVNNFGYESINYNYIGTSVRVPECSGTRAFEFQIAPIWWAEPPGSASLGGALPP